MDPSDPALTNRLAKPTPNKIAGRQLHFWVTEADYEFVCSVAADNEETIAATVRRMIRAARRMKLLQTTNQLKQLSQTKP